MHRLFVNIQQRPREKTQGAQNHRDTASHANSSRRGETRVCRVFAVPARSLPAHLLCSPRTVGTLHPRNRARGVVAHAQLAPNIRKNDRPSCAVHSRAQSTSVRSPRPGAREQPTTPGRGAPTSTSLGRPSALLAHIQIQTSKTRQATELPPKYLPKSAACAAAAAIDLEQHKALLLPITRHSSRAGGAVPKEGAT